MAGGEEPWWGEEARRAVSLRAAQTGQETEKATL